MLLIKLENTMIFYFHGWSSFRCGKKRFILKPLFLQFCKCNNCANFIDCFYRNEFKATVFFSVWVLCTIYYECISYQANWFYLLNKSSSRRHNVAENYDVTAVKRFKTIINSEWFFYCYVKETTKQTNINILIYYI